MTSLTPFRLISLQLLTSKHFANTLPIFASWPPWINSAHTRPLYTEMTSDTTYANARVLVVCWKHADPGFKEEGEAIGQMFSDVLQYDVSYLAIPSSSSEQTSLQHPGSSGNGIQDTLTGKGFLHHCSHPRNEGRDGSARWRRHPKPYTSIFAITHRAHRIFILSGNRFDNKLHVN